MLPALLCVALAAPLQRDPSGYGSESFAPFDPRTWASPSGAWSLRLDPSSPNGKGGAHFALRHGNDVAWQGERPFTLLRAAVGDEGDVVGYALVDRLFQRPRILLTALAPDGSTRWEREFERVLTNAMHAPRYPVPRAFAYDETGDRIALRTIEHTDARQGGVWWFFDAESGETLGGWYDGEPRTVALERGATPALLASLDAATAEHLAEWEGAAPPPRATAPAPLVAPRLLAEVPLERDVLGPPARGRIAAWAIERAADGDDAPSFHLVRRVSKHEVLLETRAADGALVKEARVVFPGSAGPPAATAGLAFEAEAWAHVPGSAARGGGARWLCGALLDGARVVLTFDGATDAPVVLARLSGDVLRIEALAARSDGSFALCARGRTGAGFEALLVELGPDGDELWRRERGDGRPNEESTPSVPELATPEALAFDRNGRVVVLDAGAQTLTTYGADGTLVRAVRLDAAAALTYPCVLRRANARNVSGAAWLVVDPDGAGARLLGDDGREIRAYPLEIAGDARWPAPRMVEELRPAPDGTWWTCDGTRVLRVDENGRVVALLGGGDPGLRLGIPSVPTIDAAGRLLCIDRATHAVHVWDADGKKLHVLVPAPGDFGKHPPDALVALPASRGGGFLVRARDEGAVRFDADGERVGLEALATDFVAPLASREAAWSWDFADDRVRLLEPGEEKRDASVVVERLPDGRWLGRVDCATALADGGAAIVARSELALFDAEGAPRGPHPVIRLASAADDHFSAVSVAGGYALAETFGDEALLADLSTGRVLRLDLPPGYRATALSPGGGEVWAFDVNSLVLRRYALP